ncbi:oligosaccharide flippase family protein [Massilia sp. TS11]|uniref:oligosaccharide flippase family protein n=1 Tax=Massilia sp. TS11 TaxID=2908003 RepID=UPI001EDAD64E|nr:oligosaccharide flippase family protein [Massilia sp. TS11]MCG2584302.1 oligosaccharide flippase family protein [Massilia sp. TS11]
MPHFWRQVLTVLGGSLAAQALPLLAAPLITRLCSPQALGAFGLWFGLASVCAIGATLRLEAALILDHEREQQRIGLSVILTSATAVALAVTAVALAGRALLWPVFGHLSWPAAASIGLAAWMIACTQGMMAFATSHGAYARAARVKIWTAGAVTVSQIVLLVLGADGLGLVLGQLAGLAVGLVAAAVLLHPPLPHPRLLFGPEQRRYLARHRNFWRYSLPAGLLNASVGPLPLMLIGVQHGAQAVGLYALTQRVVSAPVSLVAASVLEVFKRQSVQEFQRLGHCSSAYLHTFRSLVLLGALPALVLFVAAPELFAWVFGARWRESGTLASILAPLCFLNFVAGPLSYVFFVAGKQRIELFWQMSLVTMTIAAYSAPLSLHQNVLAYCVGYCCMYLIYMSLSYRFSLGSGKAVTP